MALIGHRSWHAKRKGTDTMALLERNKKKKEKNENAYYNNPFTCKNCKSIISYEKFLQRKTDLKRNFGNTFCDKSCSASYNNTHKKIGTTVSKLEKWISKKLNEIFPLLEIHYNRKDTINSELDIYIPLLKTAIELNGVFHYKPIFNEDKLKKIQSNDSKKTKKCSEMGIELHVIDTSKHTYFKDSTCEFYLDIVLNIITLKTARLGIEPSSFGYI